MGLKVTAFTRTESKIPLIKSLGAHKVVLVDKDFEAFKPLALSLDAILNTIPASDLKSFDAYLSLLKMNGKLIQVGAPDVKTPLQVSFMGLIMKQISIVG